MDFRKKREYFDKINYFGYLVRDIALIYNFTHKEEYRQLCDETIDYIVQNYSVEGKIMPLYTLNNWYRDTFARTLRLFFEAYWYTKSSYILNIIEHQVSLWLTLVPRKLHNGYKIFPYGINSNGDSLISEINPNQNLILAWLFTELYFCENSRYYDDQELIDIVFQETEAALSLMTSDGELSLSESHINCYDSNYGGYSATILYYLSQIWGKWAKELSLIGNWLYYSFPISHPWNTEEDYPNWVKDRHYASNLAERIPAFYIAGVSIETNRAWVNNIIDLFPEYERYLNLKYYGLKTFPLSYLGESYSDYIGYDEPTVIEYDKQIRILWRDIEYISIDNHIFQVNGELHDNIQQNAEIKIIERHTNREYTYSTQNQAYSIVIVDYNNPLR